MPVINLTGSGEMRFWTLPVFDAARIAARQQRFHLRNAFEILRQRAPARRYSPNHVSDIVIHGCFGEAFAFRSSPQAMHHCRIFDLEHAEIRSICGSGVKLNFRALWKTHESARRLKEIGAGR